MWCVGETRERDGLGKLSKDVQANHESRKGQ